MNAPCFFEEVINRQQNLWAITKRIPHPTGWGILFGMCRSTGELAASTCAKRVKSRGEAGLLRMATAIRGMPGSEFEPRQNEAPAASTHARSAFRSGVSAGFLRSAARRFVGCREARNEPRFSRAPRHSPLQRIRKLSFGLGTYRL